MFDTKRFQTKLFFFQQPNEVQPDCDVPDNRRHQKERQSRPQRQEGAGVFRALHARWHHQAHGGMHHPVVRASTFRMVLFLV